MQLTRQEWEELQRDEQASLRKKIHDARWNGAPNGYLETQMDEMKDVNTHVDNKIEGKSS